MADPVLHLLAGPNGSGKSTFYEEIIGPVTGLAFVNADHIAAEKWPDAEMEHAYEASLAASTKRDQLIHERRSFATETVFSHPSKVDLIRQAVAAGYRVTLHIILIPEELAVTRVRYRAELGGHDVPEQKIRERFQRLWRLLRDAIEIVDEAFVYDNSNDVKPFRRVATFMSGHIVGTADWPAWTPEDLRAAAQVSS